MSIDALVSGVLHGKPQQRATRAGKPFATAVVRATVRGGTDTEAPPVCFVSVIAFDDAAVSALLALDAGDSVSLAGEATPKVYTPAGGEPRASLDLLAHAVVSPYSVQRKRQAARARDGEQHQGEGEPRAHPQARPEALGPSGQERGAQRVLELQPCSPGPRDDRPPPRGSIAGAPLDDDLPPF
jgi:single-stranded DNA-binding protein